MKEVLLIEDHGYIAEATQEVIKRSQPDAKFTLCTTAQQAMRALELRPQGWTRILLDLDIPGAIGLSLAMEIKRMGLAPITCILTGNPDFLHQAQAHGFQGYVIKEISTKDLAAALGKIIAGEQIFPPRPAPRDDEPILHLTTRQTECLELVGQGKSTKIIAQMLHLHPGTVNDHINAAMAALGVNSRAHAVQKALQLGMLRVRADIDARSATADGDANAAD